MTDTTRKLITSPPYNAATALNTQQFLADLRRDTEARARRIFDALAETSATVRSALREAGEDERYDLSRPDRFDPT